MNIWTIIVPVIVSAVLTALTLPLMIRWSYRKHLFDLEDERTIHTEEIPRLGGVAFVFSAAVAVAIALAMTDRVVLNCSGHGGLGVVVRGMGLIGSVLVVYGVGVWDDLRTLNYKYKFLAQLVSALLMVLVGNIWINDLGGLFGLTMLSPFVGKVFTVLLVMFIINAFNLIDGIDGLASSLGIITTFAVGFVLVASGQAFLAVFAFVLAASLVVFFCFNKLGSVKHHTKIFMGDGGSQTMGLVIAFLLVYLTMRKEGQPTESVSHSLVLSFSLVVIPCFDAVRVMLSRMSKGSNPFLADKTHIHHKFLHIGYGQTSTLYAILLIDMFFVGVNALLMETDVIPFPTEVKLNIILAFDVVVWCLLHTWLNYRIKVAKTL